jgi:PAS domain S-box-containing protein
MSRGDSASGGADAHSDSSPAFDATWFRRAVEAAGHAIFVTDARGRIVYVNPAFEAVTGYSPDDAVGRTPALLNSGTHSKDYFRRLWETILGGDIWSEVIVNRRANGDTYVADQTIAPITDEEGSITHFVSIQTDITERKAHETALERRQDLSARTEVAADVGGWELDLKTGELRWTVGTRRIHGVEPGYEPSLEDVLDFYHPSDREKIRTFVDRAIEWNLSYDVEARLVTTDGTARTVRTTGTPVEMDDRTVLRGTIQDVTERNARRQQLMVFNRVLRHNLRNSLNVVLGNAERVLEAIDASDGSDGAVTVPVDETRADLEAIVSATEDLLDVSERARKFDSVSQQVRDVEPVAVGDLLEAVAAAYRDGEATLRVEGSNPVVLANRYAIRVAIGELVDNALEHATDDRPVVTLGVAEVDGTLRLSVADRGDGIPEMEREVIADGEERPLKHGSGLGLWLVKWLVTPLGGTVEIEDNEPTGTVVSLVFPASRWQSTQSTAEM